VLTALLGFGLLIPNAHAALNGRTTASSTFVDDEKQRHSADRLVDGLLGQGWAEGDDGNGEGAWFEIDLGRTTDIASVSFWAGNLSKGKQSFKQYSRPRTIVVTLTGGPGAPVEIEYLLEDRMTRLDLVLDESTQARKLRVDVVDVYEGIIFSEMYFAEVAVNFGRSGDRMEGLIKWLDGTAGIKAAEQHDQEMKELYKAVKAAEFGDLATLRRIMDQAGDGPDYLRARAKSLVDVGYRAAAIRPSQTAMSALKKLKDPNAIPAIEMAALRSWGRSEREYTDLSEIFYAHQELLGARNNLPNWGSTGWELGALQGFGEPLNIEIDRHGNLYVADIGNNRVQRFNYDGRGEKQWGGDSGGITDAWFREGRKFYASGATPGDGPGEFVNPLDLCLIPGAEGEGFAVLDYEMRVQVYDEEGRLRIGWTVDTDARLDPGVGGEGFIAWVPRKKAIYTVIGQYLVGFTLDGDEVLRVELEDGTPNGLEVYKGKLLMVYGREIVRYDLDGFRWGVVLDEGDLGVGYEDLDITVDENGKLWAITDKGWAFKFKSPGKLDYKIKLSEVELVRPRIALQEDIIYATDRNRIIRVDALQAKMDADAEAEASGE
jgi:hypothetical protein